MGQKLKSGRKLFVFLYVLLLHVASELGLGHYFKIVVKAFQDSIALKKHENVR